MISMGRLLIANTLSALVIGGAAFSITGFQSRIVPPCVGDILEAPSRSRRVIVRMSETTAENDPILTRQEEELLEQLHAKLTDEQAETSKVLGEALPSMNPNLIIKLRQAGNSSNEKIRFVSNCINKVLESQLEAAASTLKDLLEAGEIRKLDALIGKAAREGKLNVPFFNVLNVNLRDAAADVASNIKETDADTTEEGGAASRLQILQHVYTRCQEEMEKSIAPGLALLNRLLRQEQESIRKNLYEHYLTPQSNKVTTPDGKEIELKGQAPPMVKLDEFVSAISKTVEQIRTVENAGGTDRASAATMVESCRQIAKEARVIIGERYGVESDELEAFQQGLQPVFRPSSPDSPYIKGETASAQA
mmetsp:Transcript_9385/g.25927  ORF Transcript_9385/g.25927 Transcript_9385/m.25927 type:complete len:364 (-) Transcript_9385:924-2015(-)